MLIRNNRKMRFFAFAGVNAHLSRSNGFEFAFKFAIDQIPASLECPIQEGISVRRNGDQNPSAELEKTDPESYRFSAGCSKNPENAWSDAET